MTIFDDFFETQMAYLANAIDWQGLTVIEYGAQHARHSLALIGLGAKRAMAVEGRQSNLDQVNNPDNLPLEVTCADIRDLMNQNDPGKFDVGLILGVLYHLDMPVRFLLSELPRIKNHLFIWTHYVNTTQIEQAGYYGNIWLDSGSDKSSSLYPMAAFWFDKNELLRCLRDNGFYVAEVVDMPTPVSPQYPGMMIHAIRRRTHEA